MNARLWTNINQVISSQHDVLIMLNNNDTVSNISQVFQCTNQLLIVSLMKADGWLIQNIGNALQLRSNLGCQPYPLRLSATQRPGGAAQRKITQTHIQKKTQTTANFLADILGNQVLTGIHALFKVYKPIL